jgi:ribonuclease D
MNYEMITTPAALQQAVQRLTGEPLLACDLEADSMHHYREKVCLVQISVPGATFVIDPLACPDLSLLGPLFADPAVVKVFHGADYDVRSLHRDFGMAIANLFDTMIACQFLGEKEVGLAAQLKKRFGVELDKRFQQADWSRRPLSAEMLDYAALDTTLLPEFYRQLKAELQEKGRLDWVAEECELLCQVRMTERGDEPFFLRFKGAAVLSPRNLAALEELLRFRDREAERRDLPPFKILGTDPIRALAQQLPTTPAELAGIPGLSAKLVDRYGRQLLAAIAQALAQAVEQLPRYPRQSRPERSRAQETRLKRLKEWRSATATSIGMEPGLVANNALLELLAERVPSDRAALAAVPGFKGWQRECFGPELIRLLLA